MILRRYKESDDEELKAMLEIEGLNEKEMAYRKLETYVLEDENILGFFSIKEEWGFPSLQHFVVKKEHRSFKMAGELKRFFVAVVKLKGSKKAIIHTLGDKKYISKFVKYYFKVKPYSVKDNREWFLVTV